MRLSENWVERSNKRVQSDSGVVYRMEYHGQREPLKRRDVRQTQAGSALESQLGLSTAPLHSSRS
jgi:hypothetical protein